MKSCTAPISLPFYYRALPDSHRCEIVRSDEAEREAGGGWLRKVRGSRNETPKEEPTSGVRKRSAVFRAQVPEGHVSELSQAVHIRIWCARDLSLTLVPCHGRPDQQFIATCADNMAFHAGSIHRLPLSLFGGALRHDLGKVGLEPMSSAFESRVLPPALRPSSHNMAGWEGSFRRAETSAINGRITIHTLTPAEAISQAIQYRWNLVPRSAGPSSGPWSFSLPGSSQLLARKRLGWSRGGLSQTRQK